MELQRGVCSLCSENTKVLTAKSCEEFTKFLPELLLNNFLPDSEFQNIKASIKVCSVCCYKIQVAVDAKGEIDDTGDEGDATSCYFCKTEKHLLKVDSNWKYFTERTEGHVKKYPVCACPRCIFYFDTVYSFKNKLTYKFPQLAVKKKKSEPHKQSDTPKRKSVSKSPPSSKKRKIFDNCFNYLQPLCNDSFHIGKKLRDDVRLYRKIAYVNLKDVKDVTVKETPKARPIIKIKLKPKGKKSDKDNSKIQSHKLSKSDEINSESKDKRRYSVDDDNDGDNLNETPKSAIDSNTVPKRRVSVYIDNGENGEGAPSEDKTEEKEEGDVPPPETDTVPVMEDQTEPLEEAAQDIEGGTNGIENSESPNGGGESPRVDPEVVNGEAEAVPEGGDLKEGDDAEDFNLDSVTGMATLAQSGANSSDGSDTESSENKDVSKGDELDLNGSERKKKRVTFSDEVDE